MYFVIWYGDLDKDPLDQGVEAFKSWNNPAIGAKRFVERYEGKGYTCEVYHSFREIER